jgi:thymidylate kinase
VIVEFIGCTGAGKSTLVEALRHHNIDGKLAVSMPELVLGDALLDRVSHPTARNVAQELASLPYLVASAPRHHAFLRFAASTLTASAPSALHRANRLRGVARRVGMLELATRRCPTRVALADEGTALLAYMLVLDGRDPAEVDTDLARFAELVPLPDLVVHVRAPIDMLVARALARIDRGRQLGGLRHEALERLIVNTVDVFDRLASAPRLVSRVLAVESTDGRPEHDQVVELANAIAQRASQAVDTPAGRPVALGDVGEAA